MRAIPLLIALTIASCASPTLPEERELASAEARWDARSFPDYEMELRISCYCPTEVGDWARVRVEGGRVTQVMRLSDRTIYAPHLWTMWHSIDDIFERLRSVPGSDVYARFTATFDPALGFPREANLIERPNIADAGIAWSIRNVVPFTR
ncbi:MAG TPA: DUF6174 domain-containing protein [Gemmatimonadales bacterium]|nr:DUF6174 domain-containing protein [Gemmatimonadales bacterium]